MSRPAFRLAELAERIGATLAGNPDTPIDRVASLVAAGPGAISFFTGGRRDAELAATRASAVILTEADAARFHGDKVVARDPYLGFARVSQILNPPPTALAGVHSAATVDRTASVAASASIGPGAVIGAGVTIGADVVVGPGSVVGEGASVGAGTRLHANVTVYPGVRLGARCIIHSGAVLGADGFGFANERGAWVKIPQVGTLVIGDDVEVGANTTIDRGALDDTVIEDGVKLDNQIQIGHNCRIGAHTAMAGCVGVAGSTRIGRHCMIGGAAMIAGHLEIADRVIVAGGTLVSRSIDEAGAYAGPFPFDSQKRWQRTAVHLRNIGDLVDRVKALEARLGGTADAARPRERE